MTIETKYNLGDKVWVMDGATPRELTVRKIKAELDGWNGSIKSPRQSEGYFLCSGNTAFCHHEWYNKNVVFPTKETLLQSL